MHSSSIRERSRKGKKEGKTLRAEAPEFIPSSAPNVRAPGCTKAVSPIKLVF